VIKIILSGIWISTFAGMTVEGNMDLHVRERMTVEGNMDLRLHGDDGTL
jgi:hypothetical protein